jgi:hypothetical protein
VGNKKNSLVGLFVPPPREPVRGPLGLANYMMLVGPPTPMMNIKTANLGEIYIELKTIGKVS